ncbi:MAG: hypothetical protein HLX51_01715 [Micrococcaceae bacterium]|nr:hypothetical protein [Micrococcaceae bacterium]
MLEQNILQGSPVCLFPNLELRLPDSVNKKGDLVDFHLIFPPDLDESKANRFLETLKTSITDDDEKHVSCADLNSRELETATVSRGAIKSAIADVYGQAAVRSDHVILIAPINGNGIRPGNGNQRKRQLSREIDKFSDGFFGNMNSVEYFLDRTRYNEVGQESVEPKPVFAGSDAHNFQDLENWLGKPISDDSNQKNVTWIKADLSFAGLQQAFIEPSERIKMQDYQPDFKEPYTYISKVAFEGTDHFPAEIDFNPNLNAIIGSRSSGKSALLAHIAHASDPEYTKEQQRAAGVPESELGPAAGHLWTKLGDQKTSVTWADGTINTGKVIYIPQNSLFSISNRHDEITEHIKRTVFKSNPALETAYSSAISNISRINGDITTCVKSWFEKRSRELATRKRLQDLGSKESIEKLVEELATQVETLQREANLSAEESAQYERIKADLTSYDLEIQKLASERKRLEPYVSVENDTVECSDLVSVSLDVEPSSELFGVERQEQYEQLLKELHSYVNEQISKFVTKAWSDNAQNEVAADNQIAEIKTTNSELLAKNDKAEGMKRPLERLEDQRSVLAEVEKEEGTLERLLEDQTTIVGDIHLLIADRKQVISALVETFNAEVQELDGLRFELESGIVNTTTERISQGFNKQSQSKFLNWDTRQVDLQAVQNDVSDFLHGVASGKQKLSKNSLPENVAHEVLNATEVFRFVAIMDEDRIGGFARSSMTPGKQALFSLRLILGESDDKWPLLLDQPEDDLDSRSIFNVIVEELKTRKKERQIIMVSHDANLVVGADSEAVVVANRHGTDQPNVRSRTFDYLTGPLENSHTTSNPGRTLGRAGIREHTCEILDGGAEAFEKRKRKYKI